MGCGGVERGRGGCEEVRFLRRLSSSCLLAPFLSPLLLARHLFIPLSLPLSLLSLFSSPPPPHCLPVSHWIPLVAQLPDSAGKLRLFKAKVCWEDQQLLLEGGKDGGKEGGREAARPDQPQVFTNVCAHTRAHKHTTAHTQRWLSSAVWFCPARRNQTKLCVSLELNHSIQSVNANH